MKDDKREKNKRLMSIFIIAIMVLSVLSAMFFGFGSSSSSSDYNGFSFSQNSQVWQTKVDGKVYSFYYHPSQIDSVNVSRSVIDSISLAKGVIITYDPESASKSSLALAQYQLSTLLQQKGYPVINAYTKKTQYSVPVLSCMNSSTEVPVVLFTDGNSTAIKLDKDCIVASTPYETEFQVLGDRLGYGILGVIS